MRGWTIIAALVVLMAGSGAHGQDARAPATSLSDAAVVEGPVEALAADGAAYAEKHGVSLIEAMRRLRAQEDSVPATDRIAATYRARLAGIAIEHEPDYRIVVTLTGSEPVPDELVMAGDMRVPIVFRTGAPATRDQILSAIRLHQADIRGALHDPPGMGVDPRTGTLVVMVEPQDVAGEGEAALTARLQAIAGVPVHVLTWADAQQQLAVDGGARLAGIDPADGKRYVCTSGFVVTDGTRTGIVTAAHCPDALSAIDPHGGPPIPLTMVSAWGARYQDVQVHVGPAAFEPYFFADTAKTKLRPLTSWRNRDSTRAGDFVCHRGERTGYHCADVVLVDYAPPGDLCAGLCEPSWVAVKGPDCRGGDSGGPVFSGTVAFGIVKGGSYAPDKSCRFYYYMSTDYLPPGWTLLRR